MPEDTKIDKNSVKFKEYQPLRCLKADLCYGTTIHFDMNGTEYVPGTDRIVTNASLWINADYWSAYHRGELKFNSETIDRDKIKSFNALISGKKFLELMDDKDLEILRVLFDDIEIVIDKPDDEVYDLLNFYLPDGRIYYYSNALYESHEIDEDRRSLYNLPIWDRGIAIYPDLEDSQLYEQYSGKDYSYVAFNDYSKNQKLELIL